LLEELCLYQAELELQNEDLRQVQQELERSQEQYRLLFESAPVGYFIMNQEAVILKTNLTGANQLGVTPWGLPHQRFTQYIVSESQGAFFQHRRQLLKTKSRGSCELQMVRAGGSLFYAQLESILLSSEAQEPLFQTALIDITEHKRVEQNNEELFEALQQKSEQVRTLSRRLAEVRELEQQKLARELHDRIGQNLTALGFQLDFIKAQLLSLAPEASLLYSHLETSLELVEQTTDHVRDVLAELRPPVLDDYGMTAALEWYAERFARWSGLAVTVRGEELQPRPTPQVENVLLRIVQEALTNVAKHAQASEVTLSIGVDRDMVYLEISDNGIGLELARQRRPIQSKSWGLLVMAERAEMVGGLCRLESYPGQGTQVIVTVPCDPDL
jgi:PAS domain S-box-containing protein